MTEQATEAREQYERMVDAGAIDLGCESCARYFGSREEPAPGTFAPRHKASPRCQSGSRPHCTCDTCF